MRFASRFNDMARHGFPRIVTTFNRSGAHRLDLSGETVTVNPPGRGDRMANPAPDRRSPVAKSLASYLARVRGSFIPGLSIPSGNRDRTTVLNKYVH
jgi:hypothetical protein